MKLPSTEGDYPLDRWITVTRFFAERELRRYVDLWIDSGKEVLIDSGKEILVDRPWARTVPLCAVEEFQKVYFLETIVMDDGHTAIMHRIAGGFDSTEAECYGRAVGVVEFMKLVDSPGRELLFRCDGCGRYIVHRRLPKKGLVIKNGTYCERCRSKARAISTSRTRERKKDELVELAAVFWPQYSQAKHRVERSEWVAMQMNSKLREGAAPIRKKWVTQNQKAIEEAVPSMQTSAVPAPRH